MSRAHHNGGEPSQRMLRVAELIRHAMADLLTRGAINDPVLDGHVVTVPRVKMSPDLKLASVYVMPLGGKDTSDVIAALIATRNTCAPRSRIASISNSRRTSASRSTTHSTTSPRSTRC